MEDALRARLLPRPAKREERFRLKLPIVEGTAPPAVEVMDRRALQGSRSWGMSPEMMRV